MGLFFPVPVSAGVGASGRMAAATAHGAAGDAICSARPSAPPRVQCPRPRVWALLGWANFRVRPRQAHCSSYVQCIQCRQDSVRGATTTTIAPATTTGTIIPPCWGAHASPGGPRRAGWRVAVPQDRIGDAANTLWPVVKVENSSVLCCTQPNVPGHASTPPTRPNGVVILSASVSACVFVPSACRWRFRRALRAARRQCVGQWMRACAPVAFFCCKSKPIGPRRQSRSITCSFPIGSHHRIVVEAGRLHSSLPSLSPTLLIMDSLCCVTSKQPAEIGQRSVMGGEMGTLRPPARLPASRRVEAGDRALETLALLPHLLHVHFFPAKWQQQLRHRSAHPSVASHPGGGGRSAAAEQQRSSAIRGWHQPARSVSSHLRLHLCLRLRL